MVSIIIPVFNVYEYIDKCMESVINQTYSDLEIILINDGSADGSDKKCEEWAKKDGRIRYVSKENEGLGPTRNLGVSMASGEYIMFVDSDDWVDVTIVEKLYNELLKTNSDIAVCDRYEVKQEDSSFNLITQETDESVIDVDNTPEIITIISTSSWAKLYRKSLYVDHHVEQPAHYYEDVTTLLLLVLSKRVCYVKEALYYYVIDRNASITNDILGLRHLVDYLETLVALFKRYNLFEQYNTHIKEICRKRVKWNLAHASKVLQHESETVFRQNIDFLDRYWTKEEMECSIIEFNLEKMFYCWGSYNLMIAMKMLMRMKTVSPPARYYGFSSLISAMDSDGNLNEVEVDHQNSFRKNQLIREFKRDFINKNVGEFKDVQYFVVDFLEERFDIGVYNDRYFTISDAFIDLEEKNNLIYEYNNRDDAEIEELWYKSCLRFIEVVRRYMKGKTIVLVKMKLTESFGNQEIKKNFENLSEIQKINQRLERYYDFFHANCPESLIVEIADSKLYYTDENFKHGCYPWHLNEYMYLEIKEKIKETIWKQM